MPKQLRRTRGLELDLRAGRDVPDRRPCRPASSFVAFGAGGRERHRLDLERLAPDSAALLLGGELDVAALPALDHALRRAARWSVAHLLVDTAEVSFLDLGVVGRLAVAHRRLALDGGGVVVLHPPECMLRVLELLNELEVPVVR